MEPNVLLNFVRYNFQANTLLEVVLDNIKIYHFKQIILKLKSLYAKHKLINQHIGVMKCRMFLFFSVD